MLLRPQPKHSASPKPKPVRITTTTTTAPGPLPQLAPKDLLPVANLNAGLVLARFPPSSQPYMNITPAQLLAASNTPNDDRVVLGAHPAVAVARAVWASVPSRTTDVALSIVSFNSAADAEAVRARWRFQDEHLLEGLAKRHKNSTYAQQEDPGLGSLDVAHYLIPATGQRGSVTRSVVRYRGTVDHYVFEIAARQQAGNDGTPVAPVVDPAPAVSEVFVRFAAQLDKLLRNPPPASSSTTATTTPAGGPAGGRATTTTTRPG